MRAYISAERLRSLLTYDCETGVFIRRVATSRVKAGEAAGYVQRGGGYRIICVDGEKYVAHRLAWLYVHGRWPKEQLDHKNLNKSDNRIDNLREATQQQNVANCPCPKNSASGLKGAYWVPKLGKWKANIHHAGKTRHLGLFETAAEAHGAYYRAAVEIHGSFARAA